MTLQHADTRSTVRWVSPASGLWVASRGGEHAGMVERIDGRYVATNARAVVLGTFDGLGDAQQAIDGIGASPRNDRVRELTRRLLGVNAGVASLLLVVAGALAVR